MFLWIDRCHGESIAEPVGRHLDQCPQCRDRAVEIERLILLVRTRCPRQTAPSRLEEQIRSLLDET